MTGAADGRRWRRGLISALVAAATVVAGCWPAVAQTVFEPDDEFGRGLEPFEADGPMTAVVSLASQSIRIFDRNGLVAMSPVSTGRKGFETPEGIFSIIERKVEHNSNLYDDAEMPFMQRITWSGVALHQGVVPKYRASHGCIRLPDGFAEQLFRTTKIATRVVIVAHDATPLPVTHPVLRQPGSNPIAATPLAPVSPKAADGSVSDGPPMMLGSQDPQTVALTTATAAVGDDGDAMSNVTATSPALSAAAARSELRARRAAAEKRLQAATKAVAAAKVRVRPALLEQGKGEKALRQALAMARRSEGRVQAAAAVVQAATSPVAQALATTQHLEEMLEHVVVTSRADAARKIAAQKAGTAMAVRDHTAKLEDERQRALNVVRAITRRLSPVTVFVSREAGRVYVRQGFQPVMDLPITIVGPDKPLGTHIFTALDGHGTEELQWYGLTVETPGGGSPLPLAEAKPRKSKSARQPPVVAPSGDPLSSARAALDRVTLPDAVLARIMPTLQPGSTLIISDLGQSIETGPGTDLVVQTKGEAAATANIAKFIAKKKAEALALTMPVERSTRRSTSWQRRERDAWNSW